MSFLDSGDWDHSDAAGVLILDNITGTHRRRDGQRRHQLHIAHVGRSAGRSCSRPVGATIFEVFNFFATEGFERAYGVNGVSKAFEFDGDSVAFIPTGSPTTGRS
jgi:hypothetical protein